MTIEQIIAELTGLAQEQAGAAHILETTRFEPELQAMTPGAIDDARRKAQACGEAIGLLRKFSMLLEKRTDLGGVSCEAFGGDNLAIFIVSEFEDWAEEDEERCEDSCWSKSAIVKTGQVLDAIHSYYASDVEVGSVDIKVPA